MEVLCLALMLVMDLSLLPALFSCKVVQLFSVITAPSGYLKARQLHDTSKASNPKPPRSVNEKRECINEPSLFQEEGTSPLDIFIMLRTGTMSPEIAKRFEASSQDGGTYTLTTLPLCQIWYNKLAVIEAEEVERGVKGSPDKKLCVKSPTVQDICLDSNSHTCTLLYSINTSLAYLVFSQGITKPSWTRLPTVAYLLLSRCEHTDCLLREGHRSVVLNQTMLNSSWNSSRSAWLIHGPPRKKVDKVYVLCVY